MTLERRSSCVPPRGRLRKVYDTHAGRTAFCRTYGVSATVHPARSRSRPAKDGVSHSMRAYTNVPALPTMQPVPPHTATVECRSIMTDSRQAYGGRRHA